MCTHTSAFTSKKLHILKARIQIKSSWSDGYRLRILGLGGAFLTDFIVMCWIPWDSHLFKKKRKRWIVPTHQKLQDSDQTLQFMWKYRRLALEGQLGAS